MARGSRSRIINETRIVDDKESLWEIRNRNDEPIEGSEVMQSKSRKNEGRRREGGGEVGGLTISGVSEVAAHG